MRKLKYCPNCKAVGSLKYRTDKYGDTEKCSKCGYEKFEPSQAPRTSAKK